MKYMGNSTCYFFNRMIYCARKRKEMYERLNQRRLWKKWHSLNSGQDLPEETGETL